MKTSPKILALAIAVCGIGTSTAQAQVTNPLAGTVTAQLVLVSGCAINAGLGSAGAPNMFGVLDFGTQPTGFSGRIVTNTSGIGPTVGATKITCSSDLTAIKLTIDGGQHAGVGSANGIGSRSMTNGTDYMPYEVYADPGVTVPYVAGVQQTLTIPTPGRMFSLPIYAMLMKTNPSALSPGIYNDTLNITLGW